MGPDWMVLWNWAWKPLGELPASDSENPALNEWLMAELRNDNSQSEAIM